MTFCKVVYYSHILLRLFTHSEIPKLTPELLRVFIRRIEVYEKFEKFSRTAGNPIIIHYTFRLPEQDGVPAIEVLAQLTAKTA